MSGSIGDELESSDLSGLIAHLSSPSSQMVDKEYRDILENLFQKNKSVPAGIYTLHGLTVAGGEYGPDARIVFKYPDNNKKGVYHDHLLSQRGMGPNITQPVILKKLNFSKKLLFLHG
jgi:hypothetical protein